MTPGGRRRPVGVVAASAAAGVVVGASVAGLFAGRLATERDEARRARHEAVAALDSVRAAAEGARTDADRARRAAALVARGLAQARRAEGLDGEEARSAWAAAVEALREAHEALDEAAVREALAGALLGLGEAELPADRARARERFAEAAGLLGADDGRAGPRARALVGLVEAGDPSGAGAALEAARAAVGAAPQDADAVRTLVRSLLAASEAGDPGAKEAHLREALPRARWLAEAGRPPLLLALVVERLAALAPAERAALLEEALRARRALAAAWPDDPAHGRALVRALMDLADAVDARRAAPLLDEAVQLARARGDPTLLVQALEAQGRVRAEAGDRAGARACLEQALAAVGALPDAAGRARARVRLGVALGPLLARDRDLARAREALEAAADGARALLASDREVAGDLVLALLHLASLDQEQGRRDEARARLEEACQVARDEPQGPAMARALGLALWRLAALDLAEGGLDEGVARLEEALAATRAAGVRLDGLEPALEQARRRRELLRGGVPGTPAEQLQQAYALLALGDHPAALLRFEAALADPAVRADVTRGHLYQAARAAAHAGERARALAWLAEDVRRRRERIAALERAIEAGGLDTDARAAARAERDRLVRHLEHARRVEPAFAGLRGAPEFEGVFE